MSRRDIGKLAVIAAVLILVVILAGRIGNMHSEEEAGMVHDAIRQATLTCYAVEGAYPDSMEYLREHYRLAYDEDRFLVTYNSFASNRFPDIYVVERGAMTL